MLRLETEVAARGLTGTAEGEERVVETKAGALLESDIVPVGEADGLTAPEAWSSRTIASTIAASLASSIKHLQCVVTTSLAPPARAGEVVTTVSRRKKGHPLFR